MRPTMPPFINEFEITRDPSPSTEKGTLSETQKTSKAENAFFKNANELIRYINQLPSYDVSQIAKKILEYPENLTFEVFLEKAGEQIDFLKGQHDIGKRKNTYLVLSDATGDPANLRLLRRSVPGEDTFSTAHDGEVDIFIQQFQSCGPFIILHANKLPMAAILLDALITQTANTLYSIESEREHDFKSSFQQSLEKKLAELQQAKKQIVYCMGLHLKVQALNKFRSDQDQRIEISSSKTNDDKKEKEEEDSIDPNTLEMSFVLLMNSMIHQSLPLESRKDQDTERSGDNSLMSSMVLLTPKNDESITITITSEDLNFSMQLLNESRVGIPDPSDLIDYFSEQYQLLFGTNKTLYRPDDGMLDRTLNAPIPANPLADEPTEDCDIFTRTFFRSYIENNSGHNESSTFEAVATVLQDFYQNYLPDQFKNLFNNIFNLLNASTTTLSTIANLEESIRFWDSFKQSSKSKADTIKNDIENPNNDFSLLNWAIHRFNDTKDLWENENFFHMEDEYTRIQATNSLVYLNQKIEEHLSDPQFEPHKPILTKMSEKVTALISEINQHQTDISSITLSDLIYHRINHGLTDGRQLSSYTNKKNVTLQSIAGIKKRGLDKLKPKEQLDVLERLGQQLINNSAHPNGLARYTRSRGCCSYWAPLFEINPQFTSTKQLHIEILQKAFIEIVIANPYNPSIRKRARRSALIDFDPINVLILRGACSEARSAIHNLLLEYPRQNREHRRDIFFQSPQSDDEIPLTACGSSSGIESDHSSDDSSSKYFSDDLSDNPDCPTFDINELYYPKF